MGVFLIPPGLPVPGEKIRAGIYWLAVVLISVVGTLFSDNLVENYGWRSPSGT